MPVRNARPYRASPSAMGSCQRRMVYWRMGLPEEYKELYELRAARGTAIHKILPDILWYVFRNDPQFSGLAKWIILGLEEPVEIPLPGYSSISGTYDALVGLQWIDGRKEIVIFDLKNYARVPDTPYESNIQQISLYAFGVNQSKDVADYCCVAGYVVYFPDSGPPATFRIELDTDIVDKASDFFSGVEARFNDQTLPERIDYSDRRCGWCHYWGRCWGSLADDIAIANKERQPPHINDVEPELSEDIISILDSRREKNNLLSTEKRLRDAIIRKMIAAGQYRIKLSDGQEFELKHIKRKDGVEYYTLE